MTNISDDYLQLSRTYFLESTSCIKSKIYRMSIIASHLSIYCAAYFISLDCGGFQETKKNPTLDQIIEYLDNKKYPDAYFDDICYISAIRNSIAHPNKWFSFKREGPINNCVMKIKVEKDDIPNSKKKMYSISVTNNLEQLKDIASDVHEKTRKILIYFGISPNTGTVLDKKKYIESEMERMTGIKNIDLEEIFKHKM